MAIEIHKSYKFALRSSLYITLGIAAFLFLLGYFFPEIPGLAILFSIPMTFLFAFAVIQYRVERFIYRRVKKIYDDVSLLESTTIPRSVTTDIKTLTEEIGKFAADKKVEIDTLKIREEYRKDFLGNVSHELKTPLFTVQGYILTLLDGAMNDEKVRSKYLDRANKGVERLIYIVKDLDLITKLEAGELQLEEEDFNILEVIQNVFDLLEMRAAKKAISLTFDMRYANPILVNGDREKIQQVITNLLINSIKYGHTNGTTEVSVENLVQNKIIVRITDNGVGILEEHIPRLFERFYRVDQSGNRSVGGSGLGLAIVKHIIEGHDEKIYVESEKGVGSEFSFTLEKAGESKN